MGGDPRSHTKPGSVWFSGWLCGVLSHEKFEIETHEPTDYENCGGSLDEPRGQRFYDIGDRLFALFGLRESSLIVEMQVDPDHYQKCTEEYCERVHLSIFAGSREHAA